MRGGLPGVFTALFTAIALFALAGYQVTSETAGERLLGRLAASLVELDRWLPAHREDIDLLARDRPQGSVHLTDMPVDVTLPAFAVVDADERQLRDVIMSIMGNSLWENGTSAFRDPDGNQRSLSVTEPVRWTTMLLDEGAHRFWTAVLALSVLLLLAFAASALIGARSPLTPVAIGAGVSAVLSLAAFLLASAASGVLDSAVDKEIMLIVRDGALIGLRDSLAIGAVAASIIGLLVLSRRNDTVSYPAQEPPDAPFA